MDERLIVIVGYDTAELLDIACVTTSLAMANQIGNLAHPVGLVKSSLLVGTRLRALRWGLVMVPW
ncbi:hypothetical protein [Streptomyces sp. LN590]|uniref:hypothetical protein n=1 Tax=Streptomyces sp. LN590 TaxID=3112980 RepID=UPI003720DF9F